MRLRGTAALLAVAAATTVTAAFVDTTTARLKKPAPKTVKAGRPWTATVEITRRGRRLDGFRPVLEVRDELGRHTYVGTETAPGVYRVRVVFPRVGPWRYSVRVGRERIARGSLRVVPG